MLARHLTNWDVSSCKSGVRNFNFAVKSRYDTPVFILRMCHKMSSTTLTFNMLNYLVQCLARGHEFCRHLESLALAG